MSDKPHKAATMQVTDDGWDPNRGWAHNLSKVLPAQHSNFFPPAAAAPVLAKSSHENKSSIIRRHSR